MYEFISMDWIVGVKNVERRSKYVEASEALLICGERERFPASLRQLRDYFLSLEGCAVNSDYRK